MTTRFLPNTRLTLHWLLYGCLCWYVIVSAIASANADDSSISTFTQSMERQDGYFPLYYDSRQDKVFLQVPLAPSPFIFQSSLPRGVGSNDLGLDRGQLGKTRLAEFRVHGPRVLLTEKNTRYLAVTDNRAERQSVQEAFAESVLFGFEVVARGPNAVLIDYTPFLYSDTHHIQAKLKELEEGDFKPDVSRSALWPERMKAFPRNTELEARVTYAGTGAGQYVRSVTPEPTAITVHLHHSLIQLPDDDYQPRRFHPNSGFNPGGFQDYAAPLQSGLQNGFINRHRLEKKDPGAALSEPKKPIVYYLDPGVPEPVRTALLDGGRWWNEAFTAIGYQNAFVVQELPADADPMDVRYNIIQWVHRATRGWSYGYSVADPRTGEILKGHVSLGSLRVRQDMLIAQGLLAPFADSGDSARLLADIETMALNRIRQLSAHEIGHTLGLAHNFAANAQERASVMDYPHPLVVINDAGELSLNEAYSSGMGPWDTFTIAYGYSEFRSRAEEKTGLAALLEQARNQQYDFIADRDARPVDGAHPTAHLWDNGAEAEVELQRLTGIRAQVLAGFGLDNLADGKPLDQLEPLLVPMYLLHRFQAEAAVKLIGGMHYRYYVKGEGNSDYRPVEAARQNAALTALLTTLEADFLQLPVRLQHLLVPKAHGSADSREDFQSRMGLIQDPITIAEASAQHSLQLMLNPERLNRLRWQHQRDSEIPSPRMLAAQLSETTLHPLRTRDDAISQRVAYLTLHQLARASRNSTTAPEVRAQLEAQLQADAAWLQRYGHRGADTDYLRYLEKRLQYFFTEGEWLDDFTPVSMPPGSPI